MPELTLGTFNLHMGRGTPGHAAPPYDVVAAVKEIDTDVLVLQEAWEPDNEPGHIQELAAALDYQVAASFVVARATCHDGVRIVAQSGPAGRGDWSIALLSRLPVRRAAIRRLGRPLPRDPGRRAVLNAVLDVDGSPFTVAGTHLPLMTEQAWRHYPALRAALPSTRHPAAFAGDLNIWGWVVDRMTPRGWRRGVRGRSYPSHRPHSQTDHILVTPSVEVVSAEVMPQMMSDHRPAVAHLRFPAAR